MALILRWRATGEPAAKPVPDDLREHGLDERVPIESFHESMNIWEEMLRELAGASPGA